MTQDDLLARYNCGPVKFTGGENALYERHLKVRGRRAFDPRRALAALD
jgi:hypothetical protein